MAGWSLLQRDIFITFAPSLSSQTGFFFFFCGIIHSRLTREWVCRNTWTSLLFFLPPQLCELGKIYASSCKLIYKLDSPCKSSMTTARVWSLTSCFSYLESIALVVRRCLEVLPCDFHCSTKEESYSCIQRLLR